MRNPSKRWRALFAGSVPKDSAYPESNEDKLRTCDDARLYVLSDGASESFNSQLWADVLVQQASSGIPSIRFTRWLKKAITQYEERSDLANLSWSQEAAFARGSFASLLVVSLLNDHIEVIAIGDTVALLASDEGIIHSLPYSESEQFQQRPHLLSTLRSRHSTQFFRELLRSLIDDRGTQESCCLARWHYPSSDASVVICATDALGEWLLRKDERSHDRLKAILGVRTQGHLADLVEKARLEDGMRRDDSSLIMIGEADDTSHT